MVSYSSCVSFFLSYIAIRYIYIKSSQCFSFSIGGDFFDFQPPPDRSYDDKKCPYEVLGVDKNSSHKEIRKAFLALSKKYHPDVNTDENASDKFKELNEAYEILTNNDKREAYDKHGFAGLDRMAQMGGMPEEFEMDDLFSSFFGSDGFHTERVQRKAEPLVYPISVPLDYFYTGKNLDLTVELTRLCKHYDECETERSDCQGPGVKVVRQQRGYGIFIQHQMRDETCLARGKGWNPNCKACPDGPMHKEEVNVTLNIEPGLKNKYNLVLDGKGQDKPGVKRGDLVFVLVEKQHELFRREGDDLHCNIEISLKESLTKFKREIDVFGQVKFAISHKGITPHDHVFRLEGKGMPIHNTSERGNLYVTISVEFPKKLTPEQVRLIEQALD